MKQFILSVFLCFSIASYATEIWNESPFLSAGDRNTFDVTPYDTVTFSHVRFHTNDIDSNKAFRAEQSGSKLEFILIEVYTDDKHDNDKDGIMNEFQSAMLPGNYTFLYREEKKTKMPWYVFCAYKYETILYYDANQIKKVSCFYAMH